VTALLAVRNRFGEAVGDRFLQQQLQALEPDAFTWGVMLEPTTLGLAERRSHLTNRKLTCKADRSKVEFYGTMEPEDPKNLWLSQGY
jgi:hypothetical protein